MTDDPYVDEETGLLPPVPPLIPAVSPPPDIGEFDEHPGDDQTSIVIEALPGDLMQPMPVAPSMSIPVGFETPIGPAGGLTGEDLGAVESAEKLVGRYEGFLARVRAIYNGSNPHPITGQSQAIEFQRVGVWYDTNNEPNGGVIGPTNSRPVPSVNVAYPFPVRHDQYEWLVAVGDIVTIIQGEDRAYYMIDDLPFLGIVIAHMDAGIIVIARQNDPPASPHIGDIYLVGTTGTGAWSALSENAVEWSGSAWSSASTPTSGRIAYATSSDDYWEGDGAKWDSRAIDTTEDNVGGAGTHSLKVKRQLLRAGPGRSWQVAPDDVNEDLQTAAAADVVYEGVIPVRAGHFSHGYRVEEPVWVFKRGRYLFCIGAPKVFVGMVYIDTVGDDDSGPDDEEDFASNHYWVKEQLPTIVYTNNQYTLSFGDRAINPTLNPALPRQGRWVDAMNLAEDAGNHGLVNGTTVVVTEVLDTVADPMGVGYVFYHIPFPTGGGLVTKGILYWDGSKIVCIAAPGDEQILKWTVASGFEWIADPS